MELDYDQPPWGLIHMIHGLAAPYAQKEERILRRQAEQDSHVHKLDKKRAKPDGGLENVISFTDEDLKGVQVPHNDVLVVTL